MGQINRGGQENINNFQQTFISSNEVSIHHLVAGTSQKVQEQITKNWCGFTSYISFVFSAEYTFLFSP